MQLLSFEYLNNNFYETWKEKPSRTIRSLCTDGCVNLEETNMHYNMWAWFTTWARGWFWFPKCSILTLNFPHLLCSQRIRNDRTNFVINRLFHFYQILRVTYFYSMSVLWNEFNFSSCEIFIRYLFDFLLLLRTLLCNERKRI